jgi:hypothetical protein
MTLSLILAGISLGMGLSAWLIGSFIHTGNPSSESSQPLKHRDVVFLPRRGQLIDRVV